VLFVHLVSFRILKHLYLGDFTLAVCPGIANSSRSIYIRTFVDYAQRNGFRVAVLNHLGALLDVPLTAPRIFTYGRHESDSCCFICHKNQLNTLYVHVVHLSIVFVVFR
jgi:predicted alpha/beta-fold hydrolase